MSIFNRRIVSQTTLRTSLCFKYFLLFARCSRSLSMLKRGDVDGIICSLERDDENEIVRCTLFLWMDLLTLNDVRKSIDDVSLTIR